MTTRRRMRWLNIFNRKRDPLSSLREVPPLELVEEERAAMAHDALLEALSRGVIKLSPYCNVAPGTSGAAIMNAISGGFFRLKTPSRYDYSSGVHTAAVYEVTQLGRNYLAGIQKQPM